MLTQSDIDAATQAASEAAWDKQAFACAADEAQQALERHNQAVGELLTKSLSLPRQVWERESRLAQVEHFVIEALNHLDRHAAGLASAALKRALAVLRK